MFGLPRMGCGQWPEEAAAEADEEKREVAETESASVRRRQRDWTKVSLSKLRTAVMLGGHLVVMRPALSA